MCLSQVRLSHTVFIFPSWMMGLCTALHVPDVHRGSFQQLQCGRGTLGPQTPLTMWKCSPMDLGIQSGHTCFCIFNPALEELFALLDEWQRKFGRALGRLFKAVIFLAVSQDHRTICANLQI